MVIAKLEKNIECQRDINFIKEYEFIMWNAFLGIETNKGLIFSRTNLNFSNHLNSNVSSLASSSFLSFSINLDLDKLNLMTDNHVQFKAEMLNNLPFVYSYFAFICSIYNINKHEGLLISGLSQDVLDKLCSMSLIQIAKLSVLNEFEFKIRFTEKTLKGILEAKNNSTLRKYLLVRNQEVINRLPSYEFKPCVKIRRRGALDQIVITREMLKLGYFKSIIALETGLTYKSISKVAGQLEREGVILKEENIRVSQTSRLDNKTKKCHASIFSSIYVKMCEVERINYRKKIDINILNKAYQEYSLMIAELINICSDSCKDKNNYLSVNQTWNLINDLLSNEASLETCRCCKNTFFYSSKQKTKEFCPYC